MCDIGGGGFQRAGEGYERRGKVETSKSTKVSSSDRYKEEAYKGGGGVKTAPIRKAVTLGNGGEEE